MVASGRKIVALVRVSPIGPNARLVSSSGSHHVRVERFGRGGQFARRVGTRARHRTLPTVCLSDIPNSGSPPLMTGTTARHNFGPGKTEAAPHLVNQVVYQTVVLDSGAV